MDITDCHVHVTASGRWFDTSYVASIGRLEQEMTQAGITQVVLIPFSHISREDVLFCLELAKKRPNTFKVAPQIEASEICLLKGYENLVVGLKIHPSLQHLHPASPAVYEILNIASNMEKPVIFDTFMQSTSIPIRFLEPGVFDELAKKNRDITFVLAHSCWPRLLDAYIVAKANPNVYLDLSYFGKVTDNMYLFHDFCRLLDKLDKKIVFGTDFPEVEMRTYTDQWQKNLHHLPKAKRERIFHDNAHEVFNL